ncbi:MAG: helix-turn-helix transcriptional regulator [Coriobacteriaceae bacterium]|nr:helix-turn-helix transcriptional regulator [Coriobacteriaceae bacterium]
MTFTEAKESARAQIGNRIYQLLEQRGMSQRRLSVEIDVEMAMVNKWINGRSLPSLPAALAMAQVFGVTVEQLALGEETK